MQLFFEPLLSVSIVLVLGGRVGDIKVAKHLTFVLNDNILIKKMRTMHHTY